MRGAKRNVLALLGLTAVVAVGWWGVGEAERTAALPEPPAVRRQVEVPSRLTDPPLEEEGVTLAAGRSWYPADVEAVSITVRVDGQADSMWGECGPPRPEILRDGVWYELVIDPEAGVLDNALVVYPGEERTFGFVTASYAASLEPGRYRAVLEQLSGGGYYAVEFDVAGAGD